VGDGVQGAGDRGAVDGFIGFGDQVGGYAGLDADQGDAVGEQVVQVSCDPEAFLGDLLAGVFFASPHHLGVTVPGDFSHDDRHDEPPEGAERVHADPAVVDRAHDQDDHAGDAAGHQ
jgi:hypothetical protein